MSRPDGRVAVSRAWTMLNHPTPKPEAFVAPNVPVERLHVPTVARGWSLSIGTILILFSVVAFAWTGFDAWIEAEAADQFLWFRLNPTQNLLHLVLGTMLLVPATDGERQARRWCVLTGAVLAAAAIAGVLLRGQPDLNVLAFDTADNVLHGVLAAGCWLAAFLSVAADPR